MKYGVSTRARVAYVRILPARLLDCELGQLSAEVSEDVAMRANSAQIRKHSLFGPRDYLDLDEGGVRVELQSPAPLVSEVVVRDSTGDGAL